MVSCPSPLSQVTYIKILKKNVFTSCKKPHSSGWRLHSPVQLKLQLFFGYSLQLSKWTIHSFLH
jgi:hypothetical protein